MDTVFKTALWGGFDKQDVIDYIEKTAKESEEQLTVAKKEQDQLSQEVSRLEALREELEAERDTLSQKNRELEERYAVLGAELAEKSAAGDQALLRVCELEALLPELERLRALELEYQTYRSHIVDAELDSRQRAGEISREAQEKSDALLMEAQRKADGLLMETQQRCNGIREALRREVQNLTAACAALRRDAAAVTSHVSAELRKMDVAAGQLPLSFDKLLEELQRLDADPS